MKSLSRRAKLESLYARPVPRSLFDETRFREVLVRRIKTFSTKFGIPLTELSEDVERYASTGDWRKCDHDRGLMLYDSVRVPRKRAGSARDWLHDAYTEAWRFGCRDIMFVDEMILETARGLARSKSSREPPEV